MPPQKNTPLRIIVPLVGALAAVGFGISVFVNANKQKATHQPQPAQGEVLPNPDREQGGEQEGNGGGLAAAPPVAPSTSPAVEPTIETQPIETTLRARPIAGDVPALAHIGSLEDDSPDLLELTPSPLGGGIASLKLAHDFVTVELVEHVELQAERTVNGTAAVPMAILEANIGGQRVALTGVGAPVWEQIAPGHLRCVIENTETGGPVLTIDRKFVITPDSLDIRVEQTLTNHTGDGVGVRLTQTGPIDLPVPRTRYGGDKRRFRYGYLLKAESQLTDTTVTADGELTSRRELFGKKQPLPNGAKAWSVSRPVMPTEKMATDGHRFVWAALTDRYFAVAIHPLIDADAITAPEDKLFTQIERIDRLVLNRTAQKQDDAIIVLRLEGALIPVGAGESADASFGIYAGPMSRPVVAGEPIPASLGLDHIVVYNFGGMCAPCTFGWLTHLLLGVLRFNHSFTGDWAVSIIILVLMVRTCLHPITRWSQIRMQRFGAQMKAIGPKQAKIKEKFGDDPKKMQGEMAQLWREEGINPAGMLGCLPMFLQSPVWIALYATLFFAADLRHEPAFYGIFQTLSGGAWSFLADLSAPDSALPLGPLAFTPPLIGGLMGRIDTVNLLPVFLGVAFFMHQKYLTPPTAGSLTPEQESQQKMIKVMSVLMFPLIMYAAPSGLALYFITNSTIAIFENKHIRSHMEKHGLLDPEKIKADRAARKKRPGFMARLQQMAEAQQKSQAEAKNQGQGFGTGKGSVPKARKIEKKTIDRKYKKRGK